MAHRAFDALLRGGRTRQEDRFRIFKQELVGDVLTILFEDQERGAAPLPLREWVEAVLKLPETVLGDDGQVVIVDAIQDVLIGKPWEEPEVVGDIMVVFRVHDWTRDREERRPDKGEAHGSMGNVVQLRRR